MSKPKILLSAFACDPVTGSEPYVGWNWAMMLASDFDVHVLTRAYNHPLIETHPNASRLTFHYFDLPGLERHNHHWRFIKPYYVLWQICVLLKVLRLAAQHRFEVIHHITYNNVDVPGFLWLVPNTGFVWGPVGGGQAPPASLRAVYGKGWWKERLRATLKASARYNPVIRAAVHRAKLVMFANQETADRLSGLPIRSALVSETAITPGAEAVSEVAPSDGVVRILWLSHVFPRKALNLAIEGFASARSNLKDGPATKLIVVGDGQSLPDARLLAQRLAIDDHINFVGAVSHAEVTRHMREADLFLFTSVQDTSGNVLLEAMINGKPIIALDHQGAKALVTQGGGRLIEIGDYQTTTTRIGHAIADLAADPALRLTMAQAARREVRERHSWDAKRKTVRALYETFVIGQRA